MILNRIQKQNVIIKHVLIVETQTMWEKQASATTHNNEDNISTKSSTQHSQSSISNTWEIIANNINTTQFYNIDNDNTDETSENRKPTINEILNHIYI